MQPAWHSSAVMATAAAEAGQVVGAGQVCWHHGCTQKLRSSGRTKVACMSKPLKHGTNQSSTAVNWTQRPGAHPGWAAQAAGTAAGRGGSSSSGSDCLLIAQRAQRRTACCCSGGRSGGCRNVQQKSILLFNLGIPGQ